MKLMTKTDADKDETYSTMGDLAPYAHFVVWTAVATLGGVFGMAGVVGFGGVLSVVSALSVLDDQYHRGTSWGGQE